MLDEKFWAKYFKVYDVLNLLIPYQELLTTVCDELDIKSGEKILEAGCGTGNLAIKIKERGGDVVGLDNCKEALEIYKKKDSRVKVVLADLSKKLPFPDNHFDKVACNNTLYTIPEEKQLSTLKELYRILKPNGKVVLSNPKRNWRPFNIYTYGVKQNFKKEGILRTIYKVSRMIIPTIKILYYNNLIQKKGNYHFFDPDEQKRLLKGAGFSHNSSTRKIYAGQVMMDSAYKI